MQVLPVKVFLPSMPSDPVAAATENPLNSEYNNQALSSGITSFVEFIGSMATLGSTAFF